MPKTRNAFALRDLLIAYEKRVEIFSLPTFSHLNDGYKWFTPIEDIYEKKGIKDNHWGQETDFLRSEASLEYLLKLIDILKKDSDNIDKHISRLRKYSLALSASNRDFNLSRFERLQFLLSRYEWLYEVFIKLIGACTDDIELTKKYLPDEYACDFGARLKAVRLTKNLRQSDIASKLDISTAAYSNYERGERDLPMLTIYRLTKILNVSADYLFGIKPYEN